MVDLDLGREVPALRRAFIFAYRPRLAISISSSSAGDRVSCRMCLFLRALHYSFCWWCGRWVHRHAALLLLYKLHRLLFDLGTLFLRGAYL